MILSHMFFGYDQRIDKLEDISRKRDLTFSWIVNVTLLEEASSNRNSKISTEGVNDH